MLCVCYFSVFVHRETQETVDSVVGFLFFISGRGGTNECIDGIKVLSPSPNNRKIDRTCSFCLIKKKKSGIYEYKNIFTFKSSTAEPEMFFFCSAVEFIQSAFTPEASTFLSTPRLIRTEERRRGFGGAGGLPNCNRNIIPSDQKCPEN